MKMGRKHVLKLSLVDRMLENLVLLTDCLKAQFC